MAIKNLTLKIQGQGHGWGQSFKSQLGSNILSDSVGKSHRSASPRSTTLEEDLIFLQFNVHDLRFKPWGPTTFWLSFQHCILWIQVLLCQSTLLFLWQGCQPWEIDFLTIYQKLPKFSLLNGIFSLLKHEMVTDYFKQFPYFAEN